MFSLPRPLAWFVFSLGEIQPTETESNTLSFAWVTFIYKWYTQLQTEPKDIKVALNGEQDLKRIKSSWTLKCGYNSKFVLCWVQSMHSLHSALSDLTCRLFLFVSLWEPFACLCLTGILSVSCQPGSDIWDLKTSEVEWKWKHVSSSSGNRVWFWDWGDWK